MCKILAIDFDSTIMNPNDVSDGQKMGNPFPDCRDVINRWHRKGYKIIIHTNRGSHPEHVEEWLKYYGIKFDEVTERKPNANVFLDDKGLRFINWKQAKEEVECLTS